MTLTKQSHVSLARVLMSDTIHHLIYLWILINRGWSPMRNLLEKETRLFTSYFAKKARMSCSFLFWSAVRLCPSCYTAVSWTFSPGWSVCHVTRSGRGRAPTKRVLDAEDLRFCAKVSPGNMWKCQNFITDVALPSQVPDFLRLVIDTTSCCLTAKLTGLWTQSKDSCSRSCSSRISNVVYWLLTPWQGLSYIKHKVTAFRKGKDSILYSEVMRW